MTTFHPIQRILILGAMLYVFEDKEAVIKMIIKGRSPTVRHVSRTHRVALDWLFDRINLDPEIQIRYIDTKHQLADILTKGKFHTVMSGIIFSIFVTISHLRSTCCTKNSSLISCSTMAKRVQNQKRRRKSCVQVATDNECFFLFYCVKFLRRIESDCI